MEKFQTALEAYFSGDTEWDTTREKLLGYLTSSADSGEASDYIEALLQSKQLSTTDSQRLAELKSEYGVPAENHHGKSPSQADPDATLVVPAASRPSQDTSSDQTIIRSPLNMKSEAVSVVSGADQAQPHTTASNSSWATLGDWQSAQTSPLIVGDTIKDRFVLEETLGIGGMGQVYKARDLRQEENEDRNPFVAVKVLNDNFKAHPDSLKMLQREARKTQRLAHPNIVIVYDFDRDGFTVYMTMELLEGEPLDELIKRHVGKGQPLKIVQPIFDGIASGLAYAHEKGLVHSDIKPSNIFLTKDGGVKILDFGIADAIKDVDKNQDETLFDVGSLGALTPAYASLERLQGASVSDPRDDIYAFACIVYELLTGVHPYGKMPANTALEQGIKPKKPKNLNRKQWAALQRGLALKQKERSSSIERFRSAFIGINRNKSIIYGVAAGLLLAIVVGIVFGPQLYRHQHLNTLVSQMRGAPESVGSILEEMRTMEESDQQTLIQLGRQEFVTYFAGRVKNLVEPSKERYGFVEAQLILDKVHNWYPDSALVKNTQAELIEEKRVLIDRLKRDFYHSIQSRSLLPSSGYDLEDVLFVLSQVDPEQTLSSSSELLEAYIDFIDRSFGLGNLKEIEAMLDIALKRFPEDKQLAGVIDRLADSFVKREQDDYVDQLRHTLDEYLSDGEIPSNPNGFLSAANELRKSSPWDDRLEKVSQLIDSSVVPKISMHIRRQEWELATTIIDQYSSLISSNSLVELKYDLAVARENQAI